jgi:hypothetical protein
MPLLPIYCDKGPGHKCPRDFLVAARTVAAPGAKFYSHKAAYIANYPRRKGCYLAQAVFAPGIANRYGLQGKAMWVPFPMETDNISGVLSRRCSITAGYAPPP